MSPLIWVKDWNIFPRAPGGRPPHLSSPSTDAIPSVNLRALQCRVRKLERVVEQVSHGGQEKLPSASTASSIRRKRLTRMCHLRFGEAVAGPPRESHRKKRCAPASSPSSSPERRDQFRRAGLPGASRSLVAGIYRQDFSVSATVALLSCCAVMREIHRSFAWHPYRQTYYRAAR